MPIITLRGDDGSTIKKTVDKIPNEQEMQSMVEFYFPGQGGPPAPQDQTGPRLDDQGRIDTTLQGLGISNVQRAPRISPEEDAALNAEEIGRRPGSPLDVLKRLGAGALGAGEEISKVGEIAGEAMIFGVKHPIQAGKAITNAVSKLTPKGVAGFTEEVIKGTYDNFRELGGMTDERGFDIDTLLDKWLDEPVSAIADMTSLGLIKGSIKAGGKGILKMAAKQEAQIKIAKRSGQSIRRMAEASIKAGATQGTPREVAKQAAISAGAGKKLVSTQQELDTLHPVLKEIGQTNLNSHAWAVDESRILGEKIMNIGEEQAKELGKIVKKIGHETIDATKLSRDIISELKAKKVITGSVDEAVDIAEEGAKNAKDAMNIVLPGNKASIKKFLAQIESKKTITVKDARSAIKTLDDSINYTNERVSDTGLKIMRRNYNDAIGNISDPYRVANGGIYDRLVRLGYAENKLKKGRTNSFKNKYKERIGFDITESPELMEAFEESMEIVGGANASIAAQTAAGSAEGTFTNLRAAQLWNHEYLKGAKAGSPIKVRGDMQGGTIDRIINRGKQTARLAFPGYSTAASESIESTITAFEKAFVAAVRLGGRALSPAKAAIKFAKSPVKGAFKATDEIFKARDEIFVGTNVLRDSLFDRNQRDPDE